MLLIDYYNKFTTETFCKKLFWALSAVMLIIMTLSSSQYGICWDEQVFTEYGDKVLKFYTSFGKDSSHYDKGWVMHYYGPFVDLLSSVLNLNNTGDIYERKHFIISIFGFLGILFTGLAAREVGNWKVALLALLLIFLTPVYFGHSMFNSKDIPFAAAYMASIYYLIRFTKEFPKVSLSTIIGVIASLGIAISIRIGGVLLFFYFALFLTNKILRTEPEAPFAFLKNKKTILVLLITLLCSYLFALLFWPYALLNPILNPLEALSVFSKFTLLDSLALFNGTRYHYWEIPWDYIPVWIYVTTPLFICGAIILFPIIIYKWKKFNEVIDEDTFLMIFFTSFFPIAFVILNESNVFDGWRHVFFVYPPLVVCCASIWYGIIHLSAQKTKYLKYITTTILVLFMLEPAIFMAKHHKYETFYFSPAIGGVKGAFKQYDIDYYGTSLRYAVEWIAENADSLEKAPSGKIRIRCYYGERISVEHFIKKYSNLEYVQAEENSNDWEYSIIQPVQSKHDPALLANWPPQGIIHQIEVDGGPIVAIQRNYNGTKEAFSIYKSADLNALINTSLNYYNAGDFLNCIAACERALVLDPKNYIALNNAGSAFNNLQLFDEGIEYCKKALEIKPDFDLAKGNLNLGIQGKKQESKEQLNAKALNYINLSFIYYQLQDYNKCIDKCEKAIAIQPNNAVPFNNICSCYNAMQQYAKAIKACERSLALDPNFELAKNNYEYAKVYNNKQP